MKRILLSLTVILASIFAGIFIGYEGWPYLSLGAVPQHDPVLSFAAMSEVGWNMTEQAFNQNSKDAKHLLLTTLKYCELGSNRDLPDPMKRALLLRSGLTKARLSVLEDEAGNSDQAKLYLSEAQEDLKAVGWRDYSQEKILQVATKHRHKPD